MRTPNLSHDRYSLHSHSQHTQNLQRFRSDAMEIPEKLLEYKLAILSVLGFVLAILSFFYLAPNLIRILNYFSPLLVSTALFLVAIVVIGRISPLVTEESAEKTGEGLLAYVASEPEHLQQLLLAEVGGETVTAH